ncbi:MAG: glucose-1-phosphate thymidylyltransferase RfbA [Candidatus Omnitrophica bacterium]|jgi:glucose-1-phosphate thymidylyltransferase|nr:glucose-1-phosphate thymidylyltransferase RfbA [Candidatus Omnitrophota bacterium]MDD5512264.1 glucose-1-phosphate thymidylyltransferase RfbA [Candidatus Omnitrophota bacterium]
MKGIILAGGKATRLHPVTKSVCKQMLPVYDKPMIYYPLSALLLAGIKEILIISTPQDTPRFRHLLGTGSQLGVSFSYAAQKEPKGIAESFLIGEKFIGKDSVCLVLGDNIFYGDNLLGLLQDAAGIDSGAVVFGYYVKNPQRYGVIAFDRRHKVVSIDEKPAKPKSNYAVCGIYFYDNEVLKIVKKIRPSPRGELEITDVNNAYLKKGKLNVKLLSRGYAWLDAGTPDTLIDASIFIKTVEDRQGLKIGCIEEVAYKMGLIKKDNLKKIASGMVSGYGAYLSKVCADE